MYEFLEAGYIGYAIRLPANSVLQRRIGYLLKRPVGRPPHEVRRYYASFTYRAQSWNTPRRVVAKVEWHPGELHPHVGFIVTNLARPPERVVAFYNQRGNNRRPSASIEHLGSKRLGSTEIGRCLVEPLGWWRVHPLPEPNSCYAVVRFNWIAV